MTKPADRDDAPSALVAPPAERLARLLDSPGLDRIAPHLPPETLHQLVRRFGMDVCAPLVGAATPEQLRSLADLDLWRPDEAGRDDRFDGGRFVEWIELLVDADIDIAARTLAAMDEDLAITGLAEWVRVFDPAVFQPSAESDDEPPDRRGGGRNRLECDLGGYLVRARRREGWDALVAVLAALADDHPRRFHVLMRGCRRLSDSTPEVDGLDDLMIAPEQQRHDVAVEREHRRSGAGYLSPADARAFLEGARRRVSQRDRLAGQWIATTYFRDTAHEEAPVPPTAEPPGEDVAEALAAIAGLLADGAPPPRPFALLEDPGSGGARLAAIRPLLAHLYDAHPAAYDKRTRELAFLTNALAAGCGLQVRAFTAREASDAAISTCNLGLERTGASLPSGFLVDHDLLTAFETGWAALYEEVSVFVADRLIAVLRGLDVVDRPLRAALDDLGREIVEERRRGTPWRAGESLDVLSPLDTPAWFALLGLFSECPIVHAMLPAIVLGRTGAVSPTAFEFISTNDQIAMVRQFMERLPDLLAD